MWWVWQEVEEAPRKIGEDDGEEFPGGGGWTGWRTGSKMEEWNRIVCLWVSVTLRVYLDRQEWMSCTQEAMLGVFPQQIGV